LGGSVGSGRTGRRGLYQNQWILRIRRRIRRRDSRLVSAAAVVSVLLWSAVLLSISFGSILSAMAPVPSLVAR
jgi:hypothetical protein